MRDDEAPPAAPLLLTAVDAGGGTPLDWVAGALEAGARVLDLQCGDGALATRLGPGRWIGVDVAASAGAARPLLRARCTALPLRRNGVDAVTLLLTLPVMADLDRVFAEIRRVLRPFGTVIALVPSASVRSWQEFRVRHLLAPVRDGPWPNRSALDHLGWIFASADFAVVADDRRRFDVPVPDAAAAQRLVTDLPAAGLWPPATAPDVRAAMFDELARLAGPDRVLPIPLRRVVARR